MKIKYLNAEDLFVFNWDKETSYRMSNLKLINYLKTLTNKELKYYLDRNKDWINTSKTEEEHTKKWEQ